MKPGISIMDPDYPITPRPEHIRPRPAVARFTPAVDPEASMLAQMQRAGPRPDLPTGTPPRHMTHNQQKELFDGWRAQVTEATAGKWLRRREVAAAVEVPEAKLTALLNSMVRAKLLLIKGKPRHRRYRANPTPPPPDPKDQETKDRCDKIAALLRERGALMQSEIQKALWLERHHMQRLLPRLLEEDRITRDRKSDNAPYYYQATSEDPQK